MGIRKSHLLGINIPTPINKNTMIEGWHGNTYLIIFDEQSEALAMTNRYGLPEVLPGFTLVGLKGWDDFIVRDSNGKFFIVPSVPTSPDHLRSYGFDIDLSAIESDNRISGKIKWYVTPLVFGGDPTADENIVWITLEEHVNAVRWWNRKYREIKA